MTPPATARYRTLRVLGRGGFGEVLCVEQVGSLGFSRTVAVKRLVAPDAAEVARFAQEARLGGLMRHRNLVATYDLDQDASGWLLVMEYVEGETLTALLRAREQGELSWDLDVALEIIAQAADGLHHAHQLRGPGGAHLGFVHRDIKPSNLMISADGLVKVLDLGVASASGAPDGHQRGTPAWMAPEQAAGGPVDARADVFALGRVMWAILPPQEPGPAAPPGAVLPTSGTGDAADRPERSAAAALAARATAARPDHRPDAASLATACRALQAAPVPLSRLASLTRRALPAASGERTEGPDRTAPVILVAAREPVAGASEVLHAGGGWTVSVSPPLAALAPQAALTSGRIGADGVSGFGPDVDRVVALAQATPPGCVAAERAAWTSPGRGTSPLVMVRIGLFRLTTGDTVDVLLGGELTGELAAIPVGTTGPFVGLQALSAAAGDPLFGRDVELDRLCARLERGCVTLTGISGVGKSSLVRAGLLPRHGDAIVLRPTSSPVKALDQALLEQPGPRLVVVDQAEELVTLASAEARRAMVTRLMALVDGGVRLVVVVREDFFAQVAMLPGWEGRITEQVEVLGPPGPDQLRDALICALHGWGFACEDEALADEVACALTGKPAAFAFLQVCGAMLWERRDRAARVVRREALAGGVDGAVGRYAEQVVSALPPALRAGVRRLFHRLVTSEGTRRPVDFADAIDAVGQAGGGAALIDRLIEARLLGVTEASSGVTQVEVSHEAILSQWSRLVRWRTDDAAFAVWAESLRSAARVWAESGRSGDTLWGPEAVGRAGSRAEAPGFAPTTVEREFLAASRLAARARSRRQWGLVATTIAALALTSAFALASRQAAIDAGDEASQAAAHATRAAELARAAYDRSRGRPDLAAWTTMRLVEHDPGDREAWRALMDAVGGRREDAVLSGHTKGLRGARISPDGRTIVTTSMDGTARLWTMDGLPLRVLDLCDTAEGLLWSPRGALYLRCGTHTAWVLDSPDGEPRALDTPDGVWLESWNLDGTAIGLCSARGLQLHAADGGHLRTISHGAGCNFLRWTEAAGLVVAWPDRLTLHTETAPVALPLQLGTLPAADGHGLLGAGYNERVTWLPWSTRAPVHTSCLTGAPYPSLAPQTGYILACDPAERDHAAIHGPGLASPTVGLRLTQALHTSAWDPSGRRVVTGGVEGEVALWSQDGRALSQGAEHGSGLVASVAWTPDGSRYVTSSEDGTARVWPGDGRSRGAVTLEAPVDAAVDDGAGGAWILLGSGALLHQDDAGHEIARCQISDPLDPRTVAADEDAWAALGDDSVTVVWPGCVSQRAPRPAAGLGWLADGAGLLLAGEGQLQVLTRQGTVPFDAGVGLSKPVILRGRTREGGFVVHDGGLTWWQLDRSGRVTGALAVPREMLFDRVCGAPDRLALVGPTGDAVLLDGSGALIAALPHPARRIPACAFSPDGERLLTPSWSSETRLWDRDGALLATLDGHEREVGGVVWSPDGALLATTGWEGRVVVRSREGALHFSLDAHRGGLAYAGWRGDGWLWSVAGGDRVLRSWPVRDADLLAFARGWVPAATLRSAPGAVKEGGEAAAHGAMDPRR